MAFETSPEIGNKHKRDKFNLSSSKAKHKNQKNINKELQLSVQEIRNTDYKTNMSACQSYQHYSFLPDWSPIVPVNSLYTMPIPVIVNPPPILSTTICPYIPTLIPPIMAPISVPNLISPITNYHEPYILESHENIHRNDMSLELEDPIEYYLSLPKDLFPSARMVTLDPNDMIDEFCKLSNVYSHVAWILDLEFGIPKSPITRPIPRYNVKLNGIYCKNTPDAIHPGFESCSEDFKRAFLFYYDYVVSTWYKSYVFLNWDTSVENFECWLMLPMRELGMCWT